MPMHAYLSTWKTTFQEFPQKSTDVIYPNVSVLPGLLLEVVLAVHGVVDHQTTWAKIRQVGYQIKGLSMNIIVLQSSCLWVRKGWKKPNLQKSTVGYHFGASWKAVMTQSLTFGKPSLSCKENLRVPFLNIRRARDILIYWSPPTCNH